MRTTVIKKLAVTLATFLLIAQPVFGQAIFGNFDCGQWVSSKTETRKAWVLGYMSGMSMATNRLGSTNERIKNGNWLDKVNSAEQIFLFIDNYCQKNPLRYIETAGMSLYSELTDK